MINLKRNILIHTAALVLISSCGAPAKDKITIAAAASMQYTIKELATDFTSNTGIECDIIIGSSGKLTAQIAQGAPFNIFLSADMKYPQYLYENKLSPETPEVYALGRLVIWTINDSIEPDLPGLTHPSITKIAIANPRTAPYGEATMEILEKNDLIDSLSDQLVYAESIAQTNQFVSTGAVSLGFTSLSSVKAEPLNNLGKWVLIDADEHQPITHGVILLKTDEEKDALASKFYSYLFSEEAGKILQEFGYSRNE